MLFFADSLAGGTQPEQVRYAIQFPSHDPVALVTYLSAVVKKLGFAVTMSTTFYPPFLLARTLATLDHLTKGRIGWNIVSSTSTAEANNFGLASLPAHDDRYERADEYMQACYGLWNSWEADAVQMDMDRKIFADPSKVHRVDFQGRWYQTPGAVHGHAVCSPASVSVSGRPVGPGTGFCRPTRRGHLQRRTRRQADARLL